MKFLSLLTIFVLALSSGAKAEQTIGQKLDNTINETNQVIGETTATAVNTTVKYAEIARLEAELAMLNTASLVDTETRAYSVKLVDSAFMVVGGFAVIKIADVTSKVPLINRWTATRAVTKAAIYLAGSYLLFEGVQKVDGSLNGTFVVSESKLLKMKADLSKRIADLKK